MRWVLIGLAALLAACDAGGSPAVDAVAPDGPPATDASPPDAAPFSCPAGGFPDGGVEVCSALAGSAAVAAATSLGDFDFTHMHAGGVFGSPVAPGLNQSFSLVVYFATVPTVRAGALSECERTASVDCCSFGPMAVVHVELSGGSELGDHPVTVEVIDATGQRLVTDGTVTFTLVDDPDTPGARVAGSISVDRAGASLSGDFDGELCPSLLIPLI